MEQDFFAMTFYQNTILDWAYALSIVVLSVVLAKAIYWMFKNVFRNLASETDLDDLIVGMIEKPIP